MKAIRSFPRFRFCSQRKAAIFTLLFFVFTAAPALCRCAHASETAPKSLQMAVSGHDCCAKKTAKTGGDCSTQCLHHSSAAEENSRFEGVVPSVSGDVFSPADLSVPAVLQVPQVSFAPVSGKDVLPPQPIFLLFRSLLI